MDREKDILQISKYLKGELDARAMHQLEKRALDDPFLADAIEGFEQVKGDQKANLGDLSDRLHKRIAQKERRIIPWGPLSIAASILIFIGAGIWFLSGKQPEKTARLAQDIKVEKKQPDTIATSSPLAAVTTEKSTDQIKPVQPIAKPSAGKSTKDNTEQLVVKEADKEIVAAEPVGNSDQQVAELYKPKKDSVATNELIVSNMAQSKKANSSLAEVAIKPKQPAPATETLLKSRADGVSATPADGTGRTITGIVIGSDDRQPIVGATVKVLGRPFGVVTNVQGKFTLQDVAGDQTLAVNYIGYSQKRVNVSNKDSLSISLEPAGSSLSEVVVTGYGVKKSNDDAEIADVTDARPKDGWHSYNQYLKKNAASPDGKTGKVKISFMVAANGSLSQLKVTKGLSDAADKKAIDLVTNGPVWTGSTDGRAKEVSVSINFHQ
ncbi:carboxypeptidase-like regulatory domain-containing protein [Mucilaginibacter sp. McL0603]|uniref:carboxypeptidase-like regulatory domain-containing protein n=1 Tax=Mucilaginibacter sp. McL0603 TaxID=3415670 RepID=UPI003CF127E4